MSFAWGYGEKNGPHVWEDHWAIAKYPKYGQSPINIETSEAKLKTDWPAPEFRYIPDRSQLVKNTGKSVQVDVQPCDFADKGDYSFRGGPVKHNYGLAQFHFHWGKDDSEGSEHTVDGQSYALEGHLVHYNRDLFKDAGEAIDKPGGLVVLGVLFKVGREHDGLQRLLDYLGHVEYAGQSVNLPAGYDPAWLLPDEKDRLRYWHYYGSLTTPPLFEAVNWIVFQEPQEVSSEQLEALRRLHSHAKDETPAVDDEYGGCILRNFRPALSKDFNTTDQTTGQAKRVQRQLYKSGD